MSLSLLDINDKEIIEAITAKYNYHLEHSLKYKSMLDAYNGKSNANVKTIELHKNMPKQKDLFNETKQTFESVILNILSDGQPRLVSELIDDYSKITGTVLKPKDFSSKLSIRARSGNKIKNIKFNDFPLEKRFWWGLSDWFDGSLFKPEYVFKVHEKFKNM